MYMTTAFQPSAYQNDAFQIDDAPLVGGGFFSYSDRQIELKRLDKLKKLEALEEIKQEIAVIEQAEKPLALTAKRDFEAEVKYSALQDEIRNLRIERDLLIRAIDDEEAITALLLMGAFH